jgi:uncharacterized DUF497 family protein
LANGKHGVSIEDAMQLDTTNRGFHPDDIERLCEERRKGAGISTRDFGVSHDFSSM